MTNSLIESNSINTHWDCPECEGTGAVNGETCPECLGAKYIDIDAVTSWMLNFMESRGCNPDEIDQLRTENPDPLTLTFCLELCLALK